MGSFAVRLKNASISEMFEKLGIPADTIASLRQRITDLRVNIVGYAIEDTSLQETFARWARLGGEAWTG